MLNGTTEAYLMEQQNILNGTREAQLMDQQKPT